MPFEVRKLIWWNADQLDLPDPLKMQPVIHLSHITLYVAQPEDTARIAPDMLARILSFEDDEPTIENNLAHSPKRSDFQFLALKKGDIVHWIVWYQSSDNVEQDKPVLEKWQKTIKHQIVFPEYHWKDFNMQKQKVDNSHAGHGVVQCWNASRRILQQLQNDLGAFQISWEYSKISICGAFYWIFAIIF